MAEVLQKNNMKKNPILLRATKGSPMQENYLGKLVKKAGRKIKERVVNRVKTKVNEVTGKINKFKDFFDVDKE